MTDVESKGSKLKIAIVVHGRFHAFDLARALLLRGHHVTLFTNYPAWAVQQFGVKRENVHSFWLHGVLSRLNGWLLQKVGIPYFEAGLHTLFGRWAAERLKRENWDFIHCWSGVSEEILKELEGTPSLKLLLRGSSHIRTQAAILEEEERRTQTRLEKPSAWMIAREEREYALSNHIRLLSNFTQRSFVDEGVGSQKLHLIPSGVSTEDFRPAPALVEERCRRILSGEPLRVLYVGAISFRKGLWDMVALLRAVKPGEFRFRLVGSIHREIKGLLPEIRSRAEIIPYQPQWELPRWYEWADLFLFMTLEDGGPAVLVQAAAGGLPILVTQNCSGSDLIQDGKTGWVLPIRSPEAFVERLRWCSGHRSELAQMVRNSQTHRLRDWTDVASDFESLYAGWQEAGKTF